MLRGIDVSENNGRVNWQEVAHSGVQFAIIRIGYGNGHLDGELYRNVNNALLHKELETWQAKSKTTELLLKNANASFELYAKEEKSKIEKAKRQRNLYIFLSTCLAYSLVKQLN